jgi:TPR repeat protein
MAFKWYLEAAKAGSAEGQAKVANMYEEGIGVNKDHEAAIYWIKQYEKNANK